MLKANREIILQMLYNRIYNKYLFILYNNINFYKKIQNYCIYNTFYQVAYTTSDICFMKELKYLNSNNINYNAI